MRVLIRNVSVTLLLFAGLGACGFGADWPCYRGPAQDGVVTDKQLNFDWPATGPKLLWSKPISAGGGGNVTHGGPIVADGKVFVPSRAVPKDVLFCFDAETGNQLWKVESDAPGGMGYGSGARATPTYADGRIYHLGAFGNLVCFDAKDGAKVWECQLVSALRGVVPKFGVASAPLVCGDAVICEPGAADGAIVALDRKTGAEIWKSGAGAAGYAPSEVGEIAGTKFVLCFTAAGLLALNPADGKELWRIKYDCSKNIASPVVAGDTVYLSNFDWGLSAWKIAKTADSWTATKLWLNGEDKDHTSSFIVTPSAIYLFQLDLEGESKLKAVDPRDGHLLWSVDAGCKGEINCSLILANERHLLAAYGDGNVALFEVTPQKGEVKCRFKATEPMSFAPAAVANGRLYTRGGQTLACFDLQNK